MKLTGKQRLGVGAAGTAVILGAAGVGVWQTSSPASADAPVAVTPSAQPLAASTKSPAKPGKIDLNTATQAELESLAGIGPVKAKAVISGRPYAKVSDVQRVSGIGAKTFAKIAPQLTVGGE